jgi:hypothetical protein
MPSPYEPDPQQRHMMAALAENDNLSRLYSSLYAKGAVPGQLVFGLTFEGKRDQTIRVTNIRLVILKRTAPLRGTLFGMEVQGSGVVRSAYFNLDSALPIAREFTKDREVRGPFFRDNYLTVGNQEQEPLTIRVETFRYTVYFVLEIDYSIDGERKKLIVDDKGEPFRITGIPCRNYQKAYTMTAVGNRYVLAENPNYTVDPQHCG